MLISTSAMRIILVLTCVSILQFFHICAISGNLGKLCCLLHHKFLYQQYTICWYVHYHVPPLQTAILLDDIASKYIVTRFCLVVYKATCISHDGMISIFSANQWSWHGSCISSEIFQIYIQS